MITTTLRSEWIKLRSARSLFILQIMTAIVTIGVSYLHCRGYRVAAGDDPTQISLFGLTLGVFFAGVIFSSELRTRADAAAALGCNLCGAMLGGLLENLSMIVGLKAIVLLALAIYLGSLYTALKMRAVSALSTP